MILRTLKPSRHALRHRIATYYMHRELVCDIPAGEDHPRVTIFFEPAKTQFVTIFEMRLPEPLKLGLPGRRISEVIEINSLDNAQWPNSRIAWVEEQRILRPGPRPKRIRAPVDSKVRTLIYSR